MKLNQLVLVLSIMLLAACLPTGLTPVSLLGGTPLPTPNVMATPTFVIPTAIVTQPQPGVIPKPTQMPSGLALAEFCRIPTEAPTPRPGDMLYFRVERQGWYRTADRFATSEWVAPYGILSHNLLYLVTFDCQGVGTVCVASPPTAKPTALPIRYAPANGDMFGPRWLSDNQRLVFSAGTKTPEGDLDARLHLLDLDSTQIIELTRNIRYDYDVSPVGECVAYTAYKEDVDDYQFNIVALDGVRVRETWRAPVDRDGTGRIKWPELDEPMTWSWDDQRLAYVKDLADEIRLWDLTTGDQQVYKICVRGKGACAASNLRWSPDGTRIYFHSGVTHWILNLTTGSVKQPWLMWASG